MAAVLYKENAYSAKEELQGNIFAKSHQIDYKCDDHHSIVNWCDIDTLCLCCSAVCIIYHIHRKVMCNNIPYSNLDRTGHVLKQGCCDVILYVWSTPYTSHIMLASMHYVRSLLN